MEQKNYMKLLVEMTKTENEEKAFEAIQNLLKQQILVGMQDGKLICAKGLRVSEWRSIIGSLDNMISGVVV